MRILRALSVLASALVLMITARPGMTQISYSTAGLKGTVLDEQGGGVPNATVTVTHTGTDLSKVAMTGADGTYQILTLNPGTYRVTVEAAGFEKLVATSIVVTLGELVVYDPHLHVGAITSVVEVTGNAAPLIDTEQTQQANSITENQVQELPNVLRNFVQSVYTLPGVADSNAPRSQTLGFTGFLTTGFSIGGSNGRNNLSTIDGGENEYGTGQYRVGTIPLDDVQEFQVNRNAFAAEFGFTDGAAVNIVTKSGTNAYHGDAFGYFSDRYTNAQSYFYGVEHATDPVFPTQPYQQNLYYGGTVGGPIVKDKVFFLVSYERQNLNLANPVPLLDTCEVQGLNFAAAGLTAAECPLQVEQQTYLDEVSGIFGAASPPALALEAAYNPLTNPGYAQIITNNNGVFNYGQRNNNLIARVDYVPNPKDSLMFRFGYSRDNFIETGVDGPSLATLDFSILFNWAHTFSPTLVNQFLVQVVPWNRANTTQPDNNSTQEILVGTSPTASGILFAGTSSYYPYLAHQSRFQFEDNVTWNKGAHTVKFGASLRLADYHVTEPLWVAGQYTFVGGLFPSLYAVPPAYQLPVVATVGLGPVLTASNMMVGNLPLNWQQGFGNPAWQGWGRYFGSFLQDTWKISRSFTLTAGLRLDYDGEPDPLNSHVYVTPRMGFAWSPGDHKTVIRGGGGIYASPIDVLIPSYASLLNGTGQYLNVLGSQIFPGLPGIPTSLGGSPESPAQIIWTAGVEGDAAAGIAPNTLPLHRLTGAQITALGFPTAPNTPGQTNQVIYNAAKNYTFPYSIEASLSVERELMRNLSFELAYQYYHGVRQQEPVETAYAIASCTTGEFLTTPAEIAAGAEPVVGNCYAPALGGSLTNPTVTQRTIYSSIGSSLYNGLTASLTKRYSNNLQFQANYTFSHTIDDFIDFASFQEWYRPQQLRLYRATSVFNVPQLFVFNAVYNTSSSAQGFLGAIYRNVTIAPIVTLQSGLPYTLLTNSLANGPFGTAGTDIPGESGNSAYPIAEKRDSISGIPFYSWDMTLRKGFYVLKDERLRLDFSIQFQNILNRENFNNIANNVTCAFTAAAPTTCSPVSAASTIAPLAGGQTVNLATGPFSAIHGVKPTSSTQFNEPGYFAPGILSSALLNTNYVPRQVQFGLRLVF
jgi:hypothetical protein